jgi:transcriptional regulator with XRE-family HTH domain
MTDLMALTPPTRRRGLAISPIRFGEVRKRIGTQRDLAERIGVTERTVGRWERGEANVPAATWRVICQEAGVAAVGSDWRELVE